MDEVTLIDTLQDYLNDNLSVPVRTRSGTEDARSVPVVVLDDFDVTEITFHNTNLVDVIENTDPGVADERYFRFHYWIRLDYEVRNTSDYETALLWRTLKQLFLPLAENPHSLHDDINEVRPRGGGGFSLSNVEDAETESNYAVRIRSFHQMNNLDDAGFDDSTLDTIQNKLEDGYGDDFTVTN